MKWHERAGFVSSWSGRRFAATPVPLRYGRYWAFNAFIILHINMSETDLQHIEFEWRAFPAREQPGRAALGVGLVLLLAVAAGVMGQSAHWGGVAIIILVVALNRFFMPSRFVVSEEGICAQYPFSRRFVRWADVRRFASDVNGGFLSTRSRASLLDSIQGVHLLFGNVRDEAMRAIRGHLDASLLSASPEGARE